MKIDLDALSLILGRPALFLCGAGRTETENLNFVFGIAARSKLVSEDLQISETSLVLPADQQNFQNQLGSPESYQFLILYIWRL
jgi:hypothetical protein